MHVRELIEESSSDEDVEDTCSGNDDSLNGHSKYNKIVVGSENAYHNEKFTDKLGYPLKHRKSVSCCKFLISNLSFILGCV